MEINMQRLNMWWHSLIVRMVKIYSQEKIQPLSAVNSQFLSNLTLSPPLYDIKRVLYFLMFSWKCSKLNKTAVRLDIVRLCCCADTPCCFSVVASRWNSCLFLGKFGPTDECTFMLFQKMAITSFLPLKVKVLSRAKGKYRLLPSILWFSELWLLYLKEIPRHLEHHSIKSQDRSEFSPSVCR